jgi:DNA-binding transcriptional regulator YdaS (Cro superfamily)
VENAKPACRQPVQTEYGNSEVAKLARVSTATVSRVITGAARVAPRTSTRVLRAIEALDFKPNEAARILAIEKKLKQQIEDEREGPKESHQQ